MFYYFAGTVPPKRHRTTCKRPLRTSNLPSFGTFASETCRSCSQPQEDTNEICPNMWNTLHMLCKGMCIFSYIFSLYIRIGKNHFERQYKPHALYWIISLPAKQEWKFIPSGSCPSKRTVDFSLRWSLSTISAFRNVDLECTQNCRQVEWNRPIVCKMNST